MYKRAALVLSSQLGELDMPYAKRARYTTTYRRKSYKKPTAAFQRQTAGRSYGSNKTLDFPLSALVSVPRSAVDRRELKQATTAPLPPATPGSATGQWNYIGQIAAGDNNDQREGRAIKIVSLHISAMFYRTTVAANANIDVHRLIVGVWKPDDTSTFLPNQILQAGGANALITGGYGTAWAPQYTILYDEIINEPNAAPTGGNQWVVKHAKIPVNIIQTYTASLGTDACNNQLWVMWINQIGSLTLGQITCNTKFIDV